MSKFCTNCGQKLEDKVKFCINCGKELNVNDKTNNNIKKSETFAPKSKVIAGLLGIFLGSFGVHNFYLGYNVKGIAQLLITLLTSGFLSFVSTIWGIIEGIMILTGSINVDAKGNPLSC